MVCVGGVGGLQCGGGVEGGGRGGRAAFRFRGPLGFVGEDELDALEFVQGVRGVVFWDGVGGAKGFGLVNGAHVLCEGIGAGEGAIAFWVVLVCLCSWMLES